MVKLYTSKPVKKNDSATTDKNDEEISLFQQHNSGKVQSSVISEKTLSQVNALQDKVERIHMADDSVNINTQVSDNYITTHQGDGVKTELTQFAQTHEQNIQADDLIQHEVEQHTQTIEADNLSRHYNAPNINFDYNQVNHITGGSESITSSKNINMASQNFNLTAESANISAVSVNGGGETAQVEAGHLHINSNKAIFKIGSSMNIDSGDFNGSLTTHMNRSYLASRVDTGQDNPNFVYIKDVVYSAQTGQLYFLDGDETCDMYHAQSAHISNSDQLVTSHADDKTENNYAGVYLKSQCDTITKAMQTGQAINTAPQLYWVVHLGTMRMCMVAKTELDKLKLSLPFGKENIQNKKVDWQQLATQLEPSLKPPYKKVIIDNETALNDSIDDLSGLLEDSDKTAWTDVGSDPRQNLLFTAMGLANNTTFKEIKNPKMYASSPQATSFFFLNNKALNVVRDYYVTIDDKHGVMELKMNQLIYDSEPLLTRQTGLKQNQATKAYQIISNNSDYSVFSSYEDQNRVTTSNLSWELTPQLQTSVHPKVYLVGCYNEEDKSKYPNRTSSDNNIAYSVQYNQADKEWYIFSNTQRFLVNSEFNLLDPNQVAQKATDYPSSDYLPLSAEHTNYSFEAFMYYQYILSDYKFDENILSQSDGQHLQDHYIQLLLDASGIDKQASDLAQITQASDQANFAVQLAQGILSLPMQGDETLLLSILLPDVIGRIWYALNQYQNLESDQQDPEQINVIQQAFYRLAFWLWGAPEYQQLLKHYQAFGEYDEVDSNESSKAIWEDENSLFYLYPDPNTESTAHVISVYNHFNTDQNT